MIKNLAPITFFAYNRPEHARITIEALKKNSLASESELFIFSDGAKNDDENDLEKVKQVREYLKTIDGFKSVKIFERGKNYGCAKNIVDGVTQIVNEFGKIIVVEDDILTSPYFLNYVNDALELYKDDERVCNVDAYLSPFEFENMPQSFFAPFVEIWGWGTWQRAWKYYEFDAGKLLDKITAGGGGQSFNFYSDKQEFSKMLKMQAEGKLNTWDVQWYATNFLLNKLSLFPGKTLTQNIGFDGSGTHCKKSASNKNINSPLAENYTGLEKIPVEINCKVWNAKLKKYNSRNKKPKPSPILIRALRKIKRLVIKFQKFLFGA